MKEPQFSQYDGKVKPLFPSAARYAGYPILGLGILALLSSLAQFFVSEVTLLQLLAGPVFITMGYIMITSYEGIRLDTAFMRYRKYEWIAGFRHGEWLKLPNVVQITVAPFNAAYVIQDAVNPSFTVREDGLYRVLLSIENSRIGIIAAVDKQDQALEKANLLRQIFGTEVIFSS